MTEGNKLNGCLSNFEELGTTNRDIEEMKNIDDLLKCGICYEYFTTCVVTDCSHNFCSLCIRKYIQYKTECPICFQQLYDSQLHANRIIDNLVNIFPNLKDRIIRHLRTLKTLKPNCIYVTPTKKNDVPPPVETANVRKRYSKAPKNIIENAEEKESITPITGSSHVTNLTVETNKVIIPKIFQSPVKKCSPKVENMVQMHVSCPVCSVDILERNINVHLDDCLKRDENKERKEDNYSSKRKHLPKLVYGLMTLSVLRSKIKEHGLNAQGGFETLKSRLQKYTALYNAECDKTDPRPVQELIRQLEREEKALSSQKLPKSIFNVSRDDVPKEELNEQYLKENKNSFQKLINRVKQRKELNVFKRDSHDEQDSEEHLSVHHCEPSTSKSNFNISYNSDSDTKNWIEIEEHDVKIQPLDEIKVENFDEKPIIDFEKNDCAKDDEYDDTVSSHSQIHLRKSKRNLFQITSYNCLDSDDEDKSLTGKSEKIVEFSDEIYSNDSEDRSSSPVMMRENIRKRVKKEIPGKILRKRKK